MAVIYGTTGANDTLTGTDLADWVYGLSGDDRIEGLNGDDQLFGGSPASGG